MAAPLNARKNCVKGHEMTTGLLKSGIMRHPVLHTNSACGWRLASDGSKILFLRLDFNLINNQLAGADHRLILMNLDGTDHEQLIPDDRHTPTMEYFDW